MSFFIAGSPISGQKVLRRQQYSREMNGLEMMIETYIVRTSDVITISPAKETTHFQFSTASQKYKRLAVEAVSYNEMDGGISEMNVSFVGLTSEADLPPAIISTIPGSGVFGPSISIVAEFVSDLSVGQILSYRPSSKSAQLVNGNTGNFRMPSFINGVKMPPNPIEPYNRSSTSGFVGAGQVVVYDVIDKYDGYCISDSIDIITRGQFNVVKMTFAEKRIFRSGAGVA
jgi:hypothetical protein